MHQVPTHTLANGVPMPALGLGTWPIPDRQTEVIVKAAIDAGYRLIDTAEGYGNEQGVGRGIRSSGIDRTEVFVTTKFGRRWHGRQEAQQAFANSAERLGLDYIDLLLIHWPNPAMGRYVEAWRGMIQLLEENKVRAIGVSNFKPSHLERLIDDTGIAPHVNQIQLNPRVPRLAERHYHDGKGILTESWAPIGKGSDLLDESVLGEIGCAHSKTPAQVVLRWHQQLGVLPIPKTANPSRLTENIEVFDFELTPEDIARISTLDRLGAGAVDSDQTSF
jgi:2,5-diketo-D-gluconate reductase A